MIRHAVLSGTITAISVGVHGATARSCLIASPSFPLSKWATASHPSELENSWRISERVAELLAERDAANAFILRTFSVPLMTDATRSTAAAVACPWISKTVFGVTSLWMAILADN